MASLGLDVGPNHGLELLRALAAAGRPADMVRLLTDASVPGWAHILAAGGTFTWETWTPSDLIGDSMSHGWGSSALVAMQETLLGRLADGARSRRHGPGHRGSARGGADARDRFGADGRRTARGVVGAPGPRGAGHRPEPHRAGQRRGARAPAGDRPPPAVREGGVAADRARGVSVSSMADGTAVLGVRVGGGEYRFSTA